MWLAPLVMWPRKYSQRKVTASRWIFGAPGWSILYSFNQPITHFYRIITYVLLCGYSPFRSENNRDLVQETINARIEFHDRYWKNISDAGKRIYFPSRSLLTTFPAKNFILQLLKADPLDRPTAQGALQHPWLVVEADKEKDLSGLRENFSPRAKWKNAIDAVRAAGRISALARSHNHLIREQTSDSTRTDESGGWGTSRPGTGLRDGRTTSDEEEDDKEDTVGEEWEVKPHRHHQSSTSTSSQHASEKAKVAGVSIQPGHAHAIPGKAGGVEAKPTTADEDSDDGPHVPGAFIWGKIKNLAHLDT